MTLFAFAAVVMAVILMVAAFRRPRPAIFVAAVLWLLYAVYESQVAAGVLCDAKCNIRVDLVLFLPILLLATVLAYRSYGGLPDQARVVGIVLGAIALVVAALFAEEFVGFFALAGVAAAALAIGVYAKRSGSATNQTPT